MAELGVTLDQVRDGRVYELTVKGTTGEVTGRAKAEVTPQKITVIPKRVVFSALGDGELTPGPIYEIVSIIPVKS